MLVVTLALIVYIVILVMQQDTFLETLMEMEIMIIVKVELGLIVLMMDNVLQAILVNQMIAKILLHLHVQFQVFQKTQIQVINMLVPQQFFIIL